MAKKRSLSRRRAKAGILFVLPWIIGFVGLFLRPLLTSLVYSFSDTTISASGMIVQLKGVANYIRAFSQDAKFLRFLWTSILEMVTNVPLVLSFSLFMAVIINGKFKGRTAVRTIFFLPVICGSGLIMAIMNGDALSNSIISGSRMSMMFQADGIDTILRNIGVSEDLISAMMSVVNGVFNLTWKSGLQIILFLSGLLSISPSLYEAAKIEGATGWESFWKITFPMLSPILILNLVYSMIDSFATTSGTQFPDNVMDYIYSYAKQLDFSYSAAMSWIYFIAVVLLIGIVYRVVDKYVVYTVE